MKSVLSSVLVFSTLISFSVSMPASLRQFCPVKQSDESGGPRVIQVDDSPSRKVKINFFYPSLSRRVDSEEQTTTDVPMARGLVLADDDETTRLTAEDITTTDSPLSYDLNCQWEFQAANDSQFLLLTFEKLSAPYSDDCAEAYVAMQKQNGYESRWCGSRRQANARPMALFSRSGAKVSVYRSSNAQPFPSTGFSVVVQAVDLNAVHAVDTKLRLLEG